MFNPQSASVNGIREIIMIGFYQPTEQLNRFIREMKDEYKLSIRYLQGTVVYISGAKKRFFDSVQDPVDFCLIKVYNPEQRISAFGNSWFNLSLSRFDPLWKSGIFFPDFL